jgi:hypothetical protein
MKSKIRRRTRRKTSRRKTSRRRTRRKTSRRRTRRKTSRRRNRQRTSRRRNRQRTSRRRKNVMRGGSSELFSYVTLGSDGFGDFGDEIRTVIIKNMPLGDTLGEYGFQHMTIADEDLKTGLRTLKKHLVEGDLPEGMAKSVTMSMKDLFLRNILGQESYVKTDETRFVVDGKELRLFSLGSRFRSSQVFFREGLEPTSDTFGTMHTDFCVDDTREEYLENVKYFAKLSPQNLKSSIERIRRSAETSYENISDLQELSGNYCVLNIWISLSDEPLIHHNLAFVAKKDAPKEQDKRARFFPFAEADNISESTRYSNTIEMPNAYSSFNLEPFCGYLFQSTWVPHFSLDKTVTLEEQMASSKLGKFAREDLDEGIERKQEKLRQRAKDRRSKRRGTSAGVPPPAPPLPDQGGGSASLESWDRKRDSCEYRFLLTIEDKDLFERLMGKHYYSFNPGQINDIHY